MSGRHSDAIHVDNEPAVWASEFPWPPALRAQCEQRVEEQHKTSKTLSDAELELKISRLESVAKSQRADGTYNDVSTGELSKGLKLEVSLAAYRKEVANRKAGTNAFMMNNQSNRQAAAPAGWHGQHPLAAPPFGHAHPGGGNGRGAQQQRAAAGGGKGTLPLTSKSALPYGADDVAAVKQKAMAKGGRGNTFSSAGGGGSFVAFKPSGKGTSGGGGGGGMMLETSTKVLARNELGLGRKKSSGGGGGGGKPLSSIVGDPDFDQKQFEPTSQRGAGPSRRTRNEGGKHCSQCKKSVKPEALRRCELADDFLCLSCCDMLELVDPGTNKPKSALHRQMEEAQRHTTKRAKKTAEPEMVDLCDSDSEDDDTALAKRMQSAQERDRRPQRAAATASVPLSRLLVGLKGLFPHPDDPEAVEVSATDLAPLEPSEFLNDTVIDMYLRKLKMSLPDELRDRCHFFNTFFFKKLSQKDNERSEKPPKGEVHGEPIDVDAPQPARKDASDRAHDRVKKWTKAVDIFKRDYIFVPIHKDLHWSLAIICNPGAPPLRQLVDLMGTEDRPESGEDAAAAAAAPPAPPAAAPPAAAPPASSPDGGAIVLDDGPEPKPVEPVEPPLSPVLMHLDSMASSGHNMGNISRTLRKYLEKEWEHRQELNSVPLCDRSTRLFTTDNLPCRKMVLPQQNNCTDCGCFLLAYVKHFIAAMPLRLTLEMVDRATAAPPQGGAKGPGLRVAGADCFLGKHWFNVQRGYSLRRVLKNLVLRTMIEQSAGVVKADDPRMVKAADELHDGLAEEQRVEAQLTDKEALALAKRESKRQAASAGLRVTSLADSGDESELAEGLREGGKAAERPQQHRRASTRGAVAAARGADAADEEQGSGRRSSRLAGMARASHEELSFSDSDEVDPPKQPDKPAMALLQDCYAGCSDEGKEAAGARKAARQQSKPHHKRKVIDSDSDDLPDDSAAQPVSQPQSGGAATAPPTRAGAPPQSLPPLPPLAKRSKKEALVAAPAPERTSPVDDEGDGGGAADADSTPPIHLDSTPPVDTAVDAAPAASPADVIDLMDEGSEPPAAPSFHLVPPAQRAPEPAPRTYAKGVAKDKEGKNAKRKPASGGVGSGYGGDGYKRPPPPPNLSWKA